MRPREGGAGSSWSGSVWLETLLGMGGEEPSAKGLATRSPVIRGCSTFSLRQFSPRRLQDLGLRTASAQGLCQLEWEPLRAGDGPHQHGDMGRTSFGILLLRHPGEAGWGDAARAGWGLCGAGEGVSPARTPGCIPW